MKIKNLLIGITALTTFATASIAADFSTMPANYENAAQDYVFSRLADPRGASVQFIGQPYPVVADISGYSNLDAWAVDLRIRSRLPSGGMGGYVPYTLIFYNGEPVAFELDARKVVKLEGRQVVADKR